MLVLMASRDRSTPAKGVMSDVSGTVSENPGMLCMLRYMFKYDSTHGRYPGEVYGNSEGLFIDGKKIQSYSMK